MIIKPFSVPQLIKLRPQTSRARYAGLRLQNQAQNLETFLEV